MASISIPSSPLDGTLIIVTRPAICRLNQSDIEASHCTHIVFIRSDINKIYARPAQSDRASDFYTRFVDFDLKVASSTLAVGFVNFNDQLFLLPKAKKSE